MTSARPMESDQGDITFRDLALLVWRAKWLVMAFGLAFAVAAGAAAWVMPKKYDATVVLSPVTSQSPQGGMGALGSAVSQLSGVALLAGLGLGGAGGQKAEAIATLQSEVITTRYIRDHDLLPVLYSGIWDAEQKKWKTDDPKKTPTLWKGNQFFSKGLRKVTENAKTGLVTMTITWKDPKLAAQWANELVMLTNNYLRDKAIEESERNIVYLNQQAAKTTVVELRNAIYTLMESEIKKQMVARGSKEYALKVIDPASVPETKSSPRTLLWIVGGGFVGLMLGFVVAATRYALRSPEPAKE